MLDFNKSILENRKMLGRPFMVAHRGLCGANIPCNTMRAFRMAVTQGADVVELDVSKSKNVGINVIMIDQGSSEMNIIVGVENKDCDACIQTIYN